MQNLLLQCQPVLNNPLVSFLIISTIVWIGLQAAQINLENQFKTDYLKLMLISNWNKTPIVEFNISNQCEETQTNVNYTIPYQNSQCLCSEEMYNKKCSQNQQEKQACLQIQEFNPQIINYWPFYLRLNTLDLQKLCYRQSNLNTYYNSLLENKCLNNSFQNITQQTISNIYINRSYMVNEQMLMKDSIKLKRNSDDPIVGIHVLIQINNQLEVDSQQKQQTVIESLKAQEVWKTNNISLDNQYHPHIYHNYTYYLVAEKYIKLKDKCDCSNQVLNTLDYLMDLEQNIIWMSYLQLSLILVFILIIILFYKLNNNKILLITFIFEPVFVLLLTYYYNYHQNYIYLMDCFDYKLKNDSYSSQQIIIQIIIIIIVAPILGYAIVQQQWFIYLSQQVYALILFCCNFFVNFIKFIYKGFEKCFKFFLKQFCDLLSFCKSFCKKLFYGNPYKQAQVRPEVMEESYNSQIQNQLTHQTK